MREDLALNQLMSKWEKVTSRHPLLYLRWGHRLTWRAQQVWRLGLRLKPKFPARGEQHVKDRDVIFGTLPCVVITSLKGDAFMAIFAYVEMLQQEVEEREYSRSSCDSETQKSPMFCISKFRSKEVYSTGSWTSERERFDGTHPKILMTHLVRNLTSGKKRTISGYYPERWQSWAKSLLA